MAGCSATKQIEVPVTKIEYRDKVKVYEKVPLCNISKSKDLKVGSILELAQQLTTDLEQCNIQISVYNTTNSK